MLFPIISTAKVLYTYIKHKARALHKPRARITKPTRTFSPAPRTSSSTSSHHESASRAHTKKAYIYTTQLSAVNKQNVTNCIFRCNFLMRASLCCVHENAKNRDSFARARGMRCTVVVRRMHSHRIAVCTQC